MVRPSPRRRGEGWGEGQGDWLLSKLSQAPHPPFEHPLPANGEKNRTSLHHFAKPDVLTIKITDTKFQHAVFL
jgi:hypothetical protein